MPKSTPAAPATEIDWTARAHGATPSMAQFFHNKAMHPDCLLFFRMGDFYELFFEDAVAAASALDIALTKRGKHQDTDIPMCGVPVVQAERYLLDLIRAGFRVAICDQMEDPAEAKKRGGKAVVRREITRIITPGTLTEDELLDARRGNYLMAYAESQGAGGAAWADLSTGEVCAAPCPRDSLGALVARLAARETLIPERIAETAGVWEAIESEGAAPVPLGPASFDPASSRKRLTDLYDVKDLSGFGLFTPAETAALGAVVDYLSVTQKGVLPCLRPPRREAEDAHMRLDPATRRNLELTEALSGGRKGSLLHAVDRTLTGAGARLLAGRISAPLLDPVAIDARLDAVGRLWDDHRLRDDLREALKRCPDMARALARLGLGRGGPRDLAALRDGLTQAKRIAALFAQSEALDAPPPLLAEAAAALAKDAPAAFAARLTEALVESPSPRVSDGGFIAPGWDAELDEIRALRDDSRRVLRDMEAAAKAHTGINALKIKYNGVLGYFIEVPAGHASKLQSSPLDAEYRHRQTLASAVRFTTAALAELDAKISRAADRSLALEKTAFEALSAEAMGLNAPIAAAAEALAALDVTAAAADLAAEEGWVRPTVDASRAFHIEGGRHPVVAAALRSEGAAFVANACDLSAESDAARLILLTGPNMAGKSTYLRQNALIAILAQAGFYVPADAAHIGAADRVFSRVGAADDLARGRSTFMVEMVETAAILNQSGPRSLVILDEIGRGTATFDGLSIAWATVEHLHDVNRCRGVFATHYHELTALAERLAGVSCATAAVAEWRGEIRFLHEIRPGAADRSYGVQVARLAGLPDSVTNRAKAVLKALEAGEAASGGGAKAKAMLDDLPLFAAAAASEEPAAADPKAEQALEMLAAVDPDALTPREALERLYALKAALD